MIYIKIKIKQQALTVNLNNRAYNLFFIAGFWRATINVTDYLTILVNRLKKLIFTKWFGQILIRTDNATTGFIK